MTMAHEKLIRRYLDRINAMATPWPLPSMSLRTHSVAPLCAWKQKPKQMAKLLFNAAILGKLSHSLGDKLCAGLAIETHSAQACLFSIQFWLTVDLCVYFVCNTRQVLLLLSIYAAVTRCRQTKHRKSNFISAHTTHQHNSTHSNKFIWLMLNDRGK